MGEAVAIAQAVAETSKAAEGIAKTKTGEILAEATKNTFDEAAHTTGQILRDITPEAISGIKTVYSDRRDVREFAASSPEAIARGFARAPVAIVDELGKIPGIMVRNTKDTINSIFSSSPVAQTGKEEGIIGNFEDFIEGGAEFGGQVFIAYCILVVLFLIAIYVATDLPENLRPNLIFGGIGAIILGFILANR